MHRLSKVGGDEMFEPVLGQGLEYQIRVVENTITTDAKGREGGVSGFLLEKNLRGAKDNRPLFL